MKLSVSISPEDVEFLDSYARLHALQSRSAAVQEAVRTLRLAELAAAYEDAWSAWDDDGYAAAWEPTVDDGL